MTCFVDPDSRNVRSLIYTTSRGAEVQVCAPCDACAPVDVAFEEGEYTTILGAYKSADGSGVAAVLHITNFGRYLICGDDEALTSGLVTWGPQPAPANPANLLSVSGLSGVCALTTGDPVLQRLSGACFSLREFSLRWPCLACLLDCLVPLLLCA